VPAIVFCWLTQIRVDRVCLFSSFGKPGTHLVGVVWVTTVGPCVWHQSVAMAHVSLAGGGECGSMWSHGVICPCGHSIPCVIGPGCGCWQLGFFSLDRINCDCHEPANVQACVEERMNDADMQWWPTFHFDMYGCDDDDAMNLVSIHENDTVNSLKRKFLS